MRCSIVMALWLAGCGNLAEAPPIECAQDADCVLRPYVTCCGECPPEPPFEAIPRVQLDGILVENETQCALERRPCDPPVCVSRPEGCYVRAACETGRCVAATDGCEGAGGET